MRHPEEGEIHAWLDGAADPDEARWIEAHIATCSACAAEVATARGLIAGASRILLALDGVPGGVIPAPGSAPVSAGVTGGESVRPALEFRSLEATKAPPRRQTPWFARPSVRIAAGLMLAVGIGAVATRDSSESPEQLTVEFKTQGVGVALDSMRPAGLPSVAAPAAVGAVADRGTAGAEVGAADADLAGTARRLRSTAANEEAISRDAPGAGSTGVPSVRTPAPEAPVSQTANVPRLAAGAPAPPPAVPQSAEKSVASSASAAREEARTVAGAGLDTTRRIGSSQLRLSEVVTTGAASGGVAAAGRDARAAFSSGAPAATIFGGACFVLDVAPGPESAGISLLPSRMRIRLAESPGAADSRMARSDVSASNLRGAPARQAAPTSPLAFGVISSEPAERLSWGMPTADSVVAQLSSAAEVVEFRLEVVGDQVKGTAAVQAPSARAATVTGLRVPCGGVN